MVWTHELYGSHFFNVHKLNNDSAIAQALPTDLKIAFNASGQGRRRRLDPTQPSVAGCQRPGLAPWRAHGTNPIPHTHTHTHISPPHPAPCARRPGMWIFDMDTNILHSYGYADIYRWGGSSSQFSLIIWNQATESTFELKLSTAQAADMAGIILDYINAIMAAAQGGE